MELNFRCNLPVQVGKIDCGKDRKGVLYEKKNFGSRFGESYDVGWHGAGKLRRKLCRIYRRPWCMQSKLE